MLSPRAVGRSEFGKPPTPVGCADPGVVAHTNPVDRAAFIANGRIGPVAHDRADSGTDGGAVPGVVARAESTRRISVGKPPSPVGCADAGVVAHADPVTDDRAASVADDRAAFIAIGRVDPVADGRADSGTNGGAVPGVVARVESTRRMSVGKPPSPVGCADPGVVAHADPVADDRAASVA